MFNTTLKSLESDFVAVTSQGKIRFKQFINAAVAWADRVAHLFDTGHAYRFIPFKGIYKKLIPAKSGFVNGNIYPVPNLGNPFLGVHFTKIFMGIFMLAQQRFLRWGVRTMGLFVGLRQKCSVFCLMS